MKVCDISWITQMTAALTATLRFNFALTASLCFKAGVTAGTRAAVAKGLTSAALRFYASEDCHLLLQVTRMCVTGIITLPFWTHNIAVSVSPEA